MDDDLFQKNTHLPVKEGDEMGAMAADNDRGLTIDESVAVLSTRV
jgi:hypothetical protein